MPSKKCNIESLIRKNIAALKPYSSARDEFSGRASVYLDANENPFNSPYNRYPDPLQGPLRERVCEIKAISPEQLFLGNGSDEAIDLLFRVFCEPAKDNVVAISPSYGMYQVCADVNDVEVRSVGLKSDFSLDIDALLKASDSHSKLLFLCSPNNPTANSFPLQEILSLVKKSKAIVVVDEAYIDFSAQDSLLKYIADYENLIVLQTFSKAWGLAAIRLGMAMGNPKIISYMNMVKYPYNINKLTIEFALKELSDTSKMEAWLEVILKERKKLIRQLKMYRFVKKIFPSDANFLLVEVMNASELYDYLVSKGIIVRDRSKVYLCEGCLRLTVGSEEENELLLKELMNYQREYIESCQI